jgi:penicillin-binding protein 1A
MARAPRKKTVRRRTWGYGHLVVIVLGSGAAVSMAVGVLIVGYLLLGLPDISSLRHYNPPMVTKVLDADHNPLDYWYLERRWPVTRDRMPERLVQAFLAAEDARFYAHPGIDFMGVIRAVLRNVEAGGIVQGASTITQQVTRSLLLSSERSWIRKAKEAILAWQIDAALTKDEILTIYLNHIYFGQGAYGIQSAARTYFGKDLEDLSLAEVSLIAGLPQAPSRYNPVRHMDRAKARQDYVLKRMVDEGFISTQEAEEALAAPVELREESLDVPPGTEYFLSEVRRELEARYGRKRLLTDGLTVVTTLNREWQAKAYESVLEGIDTLCKRHPEDKKLSPNIQAALVAIDARTGAVRALIGGKDFQVSQFNMATQARNQPGSSFKPIIYAAAISQGKISPNTILIDEPISLPGAEADIPWEPENFDKVYMGPITVRTALTYSRNTVCVKVARIAGLDAILRLAAQMGIESTLAKNLSIALGSSGVSLLQMVQAYSTFPNLGNSVRPQFIQEIRDRQGREIEHLSPQSNQAMDPVTAYEMVYLLKGVIQEGTGRCARELGVPAGGKTGTTDNCCDAWFVGFTPETVAGVWIGREDRESLGNRETGGRVACPVWTSFMSATVEDLGQKDFAMPPGAALAAVDKETGELVFPHGEKNKEVIWEAMREDTLPPLDPSSGRFRMPSWLKKIDDFFFSR